VNQAAGRPLSPGVVMMMMMMMTPPPAADHFDRVTRQAELDRTMLAANGIPFHASCPPLAHGEGPPPSSSSDGAAPTLLAPRHCAEGGAMSSFGHYVNQAAPGLCGSLETLGDPRLWNYGGIEALDLVYKGSDMELSRGSAANNRPAPAPPSKTRDDDDDGSVEMISPESEAIEVERILTEDRDAVGAASGAASPASSRGSPTRPRCRWPSSRPGLRHCAVPAASSLVVAAAAAAAMTTTTRSLPVVGGAPSEPTFKRRI
jgi:hypothetical protein